MCKPINMSREMRKSLIKEFFGALNAYQPSEGKFCYEKLIKSSPQKAKIIYTETAWYKQSMLIQHNSGEVAWHPLTKRGENDFEYYVYDIIVHPQQVNGAKVDTDPVEYANWIMSDEIDPYFDDIRCRAHSHVNMGVSPSGTDLSDWDEVLKGFNSQERESIFYIFMIWNKKGEKTIKIYDFLKNILFETEDVTIEVAEDGMGLKKFIRESDKLITTKTYSTYGSRNSYYNNGYYGNSGYYNNSSYYSGGNSTPSKPKDESVLPAKSSTPTVVGDTKSVSKANKKRKGKRKDKNKGKYYSPSRGKVYDMYDDLYDDDDLPVDNRYAGYYE